MTIARRIAAYFVAPSGERATTADRDPDVAGPGERGPAPPGAAVPATRRPPPAVAVLAPPPDAAAFAAALGLSLARLHRSPTAVVCLWSPQAARSGWRAPAMPAAARLAKTLAARGHDASAAGRLVFVRLSPSSEEAASQALRASAAAGPAPALLALAGPRAAAFDELLRLQDLVVVAVAPVSDPALARLATTGLERALTCAVPPAGFARSLAMAGLALLPSTRRAVAAPVAALS